MNRDCALLYRKCAAYHVMDGKGSAAAADSGQGIEKAAFRYCLMLRIFVVFSRIQSGTKRICWLSSFINLDFINSARQSSPRRERGQGKG